MEISKIKVLELFAGTKSIGKAAKELGYEVFSTDIEEKFNTDYTVDLLEFDINKVPWKPDIIWASPPCTSFSIAGVRCHWTKEQEPKTETAIIGHKLIEKTLELIDYFKPKYWYMENPRGMLRKFPVVKDLPIRNTVTYCQYGDQRMKPTDIWTNNELWIPRPMCKNGQTCHTPSPRGTNTGTTGMRNAEERSIIPHDLCLEVLKQCKF